jgi:hypothetical protein
MKRWEEFDNPLVKVVTGSALLLFLALNFPVVFLAVVGAALSYAAALLAVTYTYRKRFKTIGRPELAVRFVAKTLAGLKKRFSRTVVRTLEERERRKRLQREREDRLRVYQRELNRRKRERARRAAVQR